MTKSELQQKKLFQLKRLASQLNIPGRSTMSKAQLVESLAGKKIEPRRPARPRKRRALAAKPKAKAAPSKPAAPAPRIKPTPPPKPLRVQAKPSPKPAQPAAKPAPPPTTLLESEDLPKHYNINRIVLMPRDPNWLFAYWELTEDRIESALQQLGIPPEQSHMIMRVHDVTDLIDPETGWFPLEKSTRYTTIELAPMADEWYIQVDHPNRTYCAECLLVAPDGRTVSLLLSNAVPTPSDRISDLTEEEWVTFTRRISRGRGPAITKWLREQARRAAPSSPRGWSPGARSGGTRL